MTRLEATRMAWGGAAGATAAAMTYLSAMPMTGSRFLDNVAATLIVLLGALIGALVERRLEFAFRAARSAIGRKSHAASAPERVSV